MNHLDLFSGIGGFALACEWAGIETIGFVEIDKFCQKVLKKHWPDVAIVEDVNNVEEIKAIITAHAELRGCLHGQPNEQSTKRGQQVQRDTRTGIDTPLLLTAGFPCQPFSNAGRKRGAADDRYLWPQTLAVIKAVQPDWVLLENVAGILNMVFPDSAASVASQASFCEVPNDEIADYNTICGGIESDLRQAGYETVWLVIPACGVGAPHRRDRVWIIANTEGRGKPSQTNKRKESESDNGNEVRDRDSAISGTVTSNNNRAGNRASTSRVDRIGQEVGKEPTQPQPEYSRQSSNASDTSNEGLQESKQSESTRLSRQSRATGCDQRGGWHENWYEVATRFCRVDARIPDRVDRLKALGNAIVPQIAYEIIKAIKEHFARLGAMPAENKGRPAIATLIEVHRGLLPQSERHTPNQVVDSQGSVCKPTDAVGPATTLVNQE